MSPLADPRLRTAALVAIAVFVLDQVTKAIVAQNMELHGTISFGPFFSLTYVRNTGAAFGIFAKSHEALRLPLLLGVTAVAIGALVAWLRRAPVEDRWLAAALGGILGGAIGNLVCRVIHGEVIDFLDVHWGDVHWPTFNVADSAITVGVAIVLLSGLRAPR